LNWVDLIVILLLIYFGARAYFHGFIHESLDLVSLAIAFFISFVLYHPLGDFFGNRLAVPVSFANVIAFTAIFLTLLFIYHFIFVLFYDRFPEAWLKSRWNKYTGILPGIARGVLVIWIVASLILIVPFSVSVKNQITGSFFGSPMVKSSPIVENFINGIFGNAVSDTLNFLTIKPQSGETVSLGFTVSDPKPDPASEQRMLDLINIERTSRGLKPLVMDEKLREVARAHSKDMFVRGYFAHNSPEGKTPFDRMDQAGIDYLTAGENLALAPDVEVAHNGLMNSPGHRANILTEDFRKVGIGCMDGGMYGKMFSQEFTD
jgi:uncharacterized protein YkwD